MQTLISRDASEPVIHRPRVCQDGQRSFAMSFTHAGQFQLTDYEEVELEIAATRLVRRRQLCSGFVRIQRIDL